MRIPGHALAAAALAAILWPLPALAQTAAVPPSAPVAASAVPPAKPEKKLLTPAEKRDSAPAGGELRTERPVTPQVSIPLTKTQPAPKSLLTPAPRSATATAPSGGIDDSAARCGALADAQAREQCRDKLPR